MADAAPSKGLYEPDYELVNNVGGWFGPNSYTQEFFGTIFWLFLAHLVQVFGLGAGFQFGLAWVITTSLFKGHFNAMTTLLKMALGGDVLDGFIRLVIQMFAGFMGFCLFYYLGFGDTGALSKTGLSLVAWRTVCDNVEADTNVCLASHEESYFNTTGLIAWARLLITLLVYFAVSARLDISGHKWITVILLLGITFAVGGADFVFAPNRFWWVGDGNWVRNAKIFGWEYLAYLCMGLLAKWLLQLYDGDTTLSWGCPTSR